MKIEAKKKVNQAFRSVIGGLYVPFPDETVYTGIITSSNILFIYLFN